MRTAQEVCENCKYYHKQLNEGGDCRRYPPQLTMQYNGEWEHYESLPSFPFVYTTTWCGEFKLKD